MKQFVILSGKGGTGKTTISAAFIKLSNIKGYADCDVDAPNLHLIIDNNKNEDSKNYYGMETAKISWDKCIGCGECYKYCRFDAIHKNNNAGEIRYVIDDILCEGCGVCSYVCPTNSINLLPKLAGETSIFKDGDKFFSTAKLKIGNGATGKLVSEVKKRLGNVCDKDTACIIDGSPGIGCPVIATLTGAKTALIVTEPTFSGISDMERIIKTAEYFGVRPLICINKYDINLHNTEKIEKFCCKNNYKFVGKIPYDIQVIKAVNEGKSIIDYDCLATRAIKEMYQNCVQYI